MRGENLLHPELQALCTEFKKQCQAAGLNVGIGETWRTAEEQNVFYAAGKSNAKGDTYQSFHQWGVAFDFFKNVKGQEFNDIPFFQKCGAIASGLGLRWGVKVNGWVDNPHIQYEKFGTIAQLKSRYGTPEKFKATWAAPTPAPAPKPEPIKEEKPMTPEQVRKADEPSDWAKNVCIAAVTSGLIQGDGNGWYGWKEPVTLERLLVIISKPEYDGFIKSVRGA